MRMPVYHDNSYPIPEGHDPDQPNPVATLVESFLSQYYERYDNIESKKMIAEAYHPNATYSMSSCFTSKYVHACLSNYFVLLMIPNASKYN